MTLDDILPNRHYYYRYLRPNAEWNICYVYLYDGDKVFSAYGQRQPITEEMLRSFADMILIPLPEELLPSPPTLSYLP